MAGSIKLFVGLGNPGTRYHRTRHNIGFWTLDAFLADHQVRWREEFQGTRATFTLDGEKLHFFKPMTFMNLSGRAVSAFANYFKIEPAEVLVVHDEADLEEGRLQIKKGGGPGGHRGIESIIYEWGQDDFYRLRVGIGKPEGAVELTDFVLMGASQELMESLAQKAVEALDLILDKGPQLAMNQVNKWKVHPLGES